MTMTSSLAARRPLLSFAAGLAISVSLGLVAVAVIGGSGGVRFAGDAGVVGALDGGDARGHALARADFDADGAPDLVVGYASQGAGIVTVQRGNPDAFAPKRQSVFERVQKGFDPEWVVGPARAMRVPEPVSYVEAGDFNRDKRPDVLGAARGGGL